MRYLLDTHVWLWLLANPERIRPTVRNVLIEPSNTLMFSVASAWEIAIKYRLGKLPLPEPPNVFIPARLLRDGVVPFPIELTHAVHVANLPDHHSDPFDRLLIAQAQIEALCLITADTNFDAYDVQLLRA